METNEIIADQEVHAESKKIMELEQALAAEQDQRLRLAADFDNYKKRMAREIQGRAASQKEALARDLLPVVDNLERALAAAGGANLQDGVKMICQQLLDAMKRHGFEPQEDLGKPFDSRIHDAIAVGSDPEKPDHSVLEVWERGWTSWSNPFRPSKVKVNKISDNHS
ncbi:MAG: nucleotide exchange factor GrpE [Verrucomicrobiales bacterium]